eukprot:1731602-Rhodomonas_salina.3
MAQEELEERLVVVKALEFRYRHSHNHGPAVMSAVLHTLDCLKTLLSQTNATIFPPPKALRSQTIP